jgi:succinate dehydrogenase/fumarate reductase flavoprotein subunit
MSLADATFFGRQAGLQAARHCHRFARINIA